MALIDHPPAILLPPNGGQSTIIDKSATITCYGVRMARQLRVEYKDAVYHVIARGNRGEPIFLDQKDRETFVRTLGEACERTGFRVFAWVLMKNHYHLVIRTPDANLIEGMRWLQNTYTRRFNVRHAQWGRLFGDRYKSILVENDLSPLSPGNGGYLTTLIDYVHLNPARAKLVGSRKGESICDYRWSSVADAFTRPPGRRPTWTEVDRVLALFGFRDTARDRRRFVDRLNLRIRSEEPERCGLSELADQSLHSTLRRGWYWGGQDFCEQMLALIGQEENRPTSRDYAGSSQGKDHSRRRAETIVSKGVAHFRLDGAESLRILKRGDRRRVAIAWAIWRQTSEPQSWIAEQTGLKSAANVSQQVRRYDRLPGTQLSAEERRWRRVVLKFVD